MLSTQRNATNNEKWLALVDYDIKSAEAMFDTGRYLYVAFLCQQAVEKLLKAIIHEKTGEMPPYTHRLPALVEVAGIVADSKQADLLVKLTRYYIRTRYPEDRTRLARTLDRTATKLLLQHTMEVLQWLKNASRM